MLPMLSSSFSAGMTMLSVASFPPVHAFRRTTLEEEICDRSSAVALMTFIGTIRACDVPVTSADRESITNQPAPVCQALSQQPGRQKSPSPPIAA